MNCFMRDPTIKVVLSSEVNGNDVTLSLDVPENQVAGAYEILNKLLASLKNPE